MRRQSRVSHTLTPPEQSWKLMLWWLTKQRKSFKACGGLFVRCLLCCDEEEAAREISCFPPRCPHRLE